MSPSETSRREELTIVSLGGRGDGFGRDASGQHWFVSRAVPGDRVEIAIEPDTRGRLRATLLRVLEPSPDRVDASCPQAAFCPGCALRTLALPAQREHKTRSWMRVLEPIAPDVRDHVRATHPSVLTDAYRSRCVAHVLRTSQGEVVLGMRGRGEDTLVDLSRCPVQTADSRALLGAVHTLLTEHPAWVGSLRYVVIEAPRPGIGARVGLISSTAEDAERHAQLARALRPEDTTLSVLSGVVPPESYAVELSELDVVRGDGRVYPEVSEGRLQQSPGAWFSNAPENATRVREAVLEAADGLLAASGHERLEGVVEVGCGVGTHAFALASRARRYMGIDRDRVAIADAEAVVDALTPEAGEVVFRVGRGARSLRRLLGQGWRAELVVLHSMREPFHRQIASAVRALGAERVVLVAPGVAALAGNLERLRGEEGGYRLDDVVFIDTMPHTAHMMAVATLSRA